MALDSNILGRRLRKARENRSLTQEQAAQVIGVSRTALVHIESGKRSLSTLELSRLSKLYHCSVTDFFHDEEEAAREGNPLLILHRLPPELLGVAEISRQVSRCVELCSIGVRLERDLGMQDVIDLPSYEQFVPSRQYWEATRQGERVAEDERRRLGLGYGPVADMADLIGTQGIWASGVQDLPDDMSGIFLRHASIGLVILVNYDHPRARKRFSYAHEYAHALLDRKAASAIVSREQNRLEFIERRANAFAAAFLMPETGVGWFMEHLEKGGPSRRQRVTYSSAGDEPVESEERPAPGSQQITYQDVVALASHFGVSYPAATYRLSDLGLVNTQEKEALLARSSLGSRLLESMNDFDRDEKGRPLRKPDRELVSHIVRLAVEAYRREERSMGWIRDLSETLGLPAAELVEMAEAAAEG